MTGLPWMNFGMGPLLRCQRFVVMSYPILDGQDIFASFLCRFYGLRHGLRIVPVRLPCLLEPVDALLNGYRLAVRASLGVHVESLPLKRDNPGRNTRTGFPALLDDIR